MKLTGKGEFEWTMAELYPASGVPPGRTLHSATATDDEVGRNFWRHEDCGLGGRILDSHLICF
jgi:hypothetical protein